MQAVEYKLRAECFADIDALLSKLVKSSVGRIFTYQINGNVDTWRVELTMVATFTPKQLLAIMARIPDSHVMMETLNYAAEYTGKRDAEFIW